MAEDLRMTNLPRGPWVSEEEMQAILNTNADAEFDAILAEIKQKPEAQAGDAKAEPDDQPQRHLRLRWVTGIAAGVLLLIAIAALWKMHIDSFDEWKQIASKHSISDTICPLQKTDLRAENREAGIVDKIDNNSASSNSSKNTNSTNNAATTASRNNASAAPSSASPASTVFGDYVAEQITEQTTEQAAQQAAEQATAPPPLSLAELTHNAEAQAEAEAWDEPQPINANELIFNMEAEEREQRFRMRIASPSPELLNELIMLTVANY